MRLDKYLTEMNIGTRSQVKEYIRQKQVTVNGNSNVKPEEKIDPEADEVLFRGQKLCFEKVQYFILNKPQGVVSATKDALSETVLALLPGDARKDLFPVGRLDKDTEGLLLISNDGALAHQLLSPKKHVEKTYLVKTRKEVSDEALQRLCEGVDIGEETPTLPAMAIRVSERSDPEGHWIHLTISEGRYHQVKRMLEAVDNEVLFLKRIRFGPLCLDRNLPTGLARRLTGEEIELLKKQKQISAQKKELLQGKKAVIFDLDGSLVDSMWIWETIDKEYLSRFGRQLVDRKVLKQKMDGLSFHETAVFFKDYFSIPDPIEKMMDDWNQMAREKYEKEVPVKGGVLEFLVKCRENGIHLGIATSNSRELASAVLKANAIEDYFDVIITASEVKKGKTSPDIYREVAKALQVAPTECLVFEDIVPAILASKSAGMTVCAVADEDSADTDAQKKECADFFTTNFYDFW